MFGHVRGAFTGAVNARRGRFSQAGRGTIFLDEVGDMSLEVQAKLLRVLQEQEFYPVGAERPERTEARVIAATHRNLEQMGLAGTFREDLYYRLRVVELTVPPLRDRASDIPVLVQHLVAAASSRLSDGKLLSHVDWSTGTLAVRDLASGQSRAIATARGDLTDFAYLSVISPDGKQVAYGFFDGEMYDLRVVDIEGGAPRTVFRRTESLDVIPMAWSPDGRQILTVIRWKDATSQMAFISIPSGATRVLKTLGWRYPSKLALSPDGRYIAYDFTRDEASDARDISILAADGGTDTPAVVHKSDDRVRGWSPDGRLFFSSDCDRTPALWALIVNDGRATGEPVRIKSDLWRLDHALGFDRSGVFYYSVNPTVADLYTATIDPVSAKITTAPQPLSGAAGVTRGPGAWSPDGRLLAYLVSDQAVSVSFSGVAIRSLETGDERRLNPQLTNLQTVLARYRVTRRAQDRGAFKTPTLRQLRFTAPYMHDGSFQTLEAVVDFYNAGERAIRTAISNCADLS